MLNLFGIKKKEVRNVIIGIIEDILKKNGFLLSFQVTKLQDNGFILDIFGEDEGLLKNKNGKLLLAIQTYILQVLYKEFPEEKIKLLVDSNGFWKEQDNKLLILTDHLIQKALRSNKVVEFRHSLSPSKRRLVHERVAKVKGLKSQSFGEGSYRSLRLIPESLRKQRI